jgi:hypothetical protein
MREITDEDLPMKLARNVTLTAYETDHDRSLAILKLYMSNFCFWRWANRIKSQKLGWYCTKSHCYGVKRPPGRTIGFIDV